MLKKWQLKESRDARDIGGKRTKGSGNQWYDPGDVQNSLLNMECKYTARKSYALSWEKLDKIFEESLLKFRIPIFSIEIAPPKQEPKEVIVMFKNDWLKLFDKYIKEQ